MRAVMAVSRWLTATRNRSSVFRSSLSLSVRALRYSSAIVPGLGGSEMHPVRQAHHRLSPAERIRPRLHHADLVA